MPLDRRAGGEAAAALGRLTGHWAARNAAVMVASLGLEYGSQFGRSMVLARSLAPAEFGLAASMAILLALVDMGTGIGADRYLVQAKDGDTATALAIAHTLTLGRGVLNAGLILLLAPITASVLHAPGEAGAYAWLAVVPLLRGLEHLWPEQVQRGHRFGPWAAASVASSVAGLGAVCAAVWVLHDHRAVVWGLSAQALAMVAATHALAAVPYRLSLAAAPLQRALRFGVPLMVNGLALAAMAQLDRLLVGSFLGLAQLGRYSLAVMLFYLPSSLLLRAMVSVFQPRLSACWHAAPESRFPRMFQRVSLGVSLAAVASAVVVCIAGNPLLGLIFGRDLQVGDTFFCVFSLAVYTRFAKNGVNVAGLAMGRTRDLMVANLFGMSGLCVTAAGLMVWPSLVVAAIGAMVGEIAGTLAAYARLGPMLGLAGQASGSLVLPGLLMPALASVWVLLWQPSMQLRLAALAGIGMTALLCLAFAPRLARRAAG